MAVAINSKGEEIVININSIFEQAKTLGEVIDFWGNTLSPKEDN
jgi:tetrahydromethanopterin S-methyltransferase subunit B